MRRSAVKPRLPSSLSSWPVERGRAYAMPASALGRLSMPANRSREVRAAPERFQSVGEMRRLARLDGERPRRRHGCRLTREERDGGLGGRAAGAVGHAAPDAERPGRRVAAGGHERKLAADVPDQGRLGHDAVGRRDAGLLWGRPGPPDVELPSIRFPAPHVGDQAPDDHRPAGIRVRIERQLEGRDRDRVELAHPELRDVRAIAPAASDRVCDPRRAIDVPDAAHDIVGCQQLAEPCRIARPECAGERLLRLAELRVAIGGAARRLS